MIARALVVLLLMLNLGVAAWWVMRPSPVPDNADRTSDGLARLQLLQEVPARAVRPATTSTTTEVQDEPAPIASEDPATSAAPAEQRCFSFGPFADAASATTARTRLASQGVLRANAREVTASPRGWRVFLPALPDRAAAEAMADRITAAGFDDYLIVPAGAEANSIALGRYGNESTARQREAALRAGGFEAQAQPLGDATTQRWLDVAAGPGFDAATARQASGAAQANPVDCAALG